MRETEDPVKKPEEDTAPAPVHTPSAFELFREDAAARATERAATKPDVTSTTAGGASPAAPAWWRSDYQMPGLVVVGGETPAGPARSRSGAPTETGGVARGGTEGRGVPAERPAGISERAGRVIHLPPDVSKMIPERMKYGAAYNPWDRVMPDESASVTKGLESLMRKAGHTKAASEERGKDGTVTKRDEMGRVISHEDPAKKTRVHLVYEGKSKEASAAVIERTDTGEKMAIKAVDSSKSGVKEFVGLTSRGEKKHIVGEIGTGADGKFDAKLKTVKPPTLDDVKGDKPHRDGKDPEKKADGKKDGKDTAPKPEAKPDAELTAARDALKRAAEKHITNPADRDAYIKDMEKFETAAKKRGLSGKEVADFYKQSERLLAGPSAHVSEADRARIASESMKHAIDPTTIRQGFHKTCNTSTVQVSMFMREPSKAMKAITDVALTGEFKTANGSTIKLPAKTLEAPPKDSARSFASQIFQELGVNVKWQPSRVTPGGEACAPGDLRYTHGFPVDDPKKDTGQRVYREEDGKPVTRVDKKTGEKKEITGPTIFIHDLPDIYKQIAGKSPETLGIAAKPRAVEVDGIKSVGSEKEFHDELTRLSQTKGGFPVILRVHTGHEPWYSNSGAGKAGGSGGWHVVTITGYDPTSKRVSIDNTWNDRVDHVQGRAGTLALADVYKSMYQAPPRPAVPAVVRPALRR